MANHERPSPFTIPEPTYKFKEGSPPEPRPSRSMTMGDLVHNLTVFADFYERASADVDREESVMKPWRVANRDANADTMRRDFRATVAIDRARAYVLANYGADLTVDTARRLLGDLIRTRGLTIDAVEALSLEAAMDQLDAANSRGGDADGAGKREAPAPSVAPERAPKRSTERGEGRVKLIAALTRHHRYADGGYLNLDPIGNNSLARAAGVSASTASVFFQDEFRGHAKYRAMCRDAGKLTAALKLLNDEFAPWLLLGDASSDLAAPEQDDADSES